jgi:single-strand DNA-binding protein
MASFNKVILMGNLTRDPELRYTPKGMAIAKFGIAVNRVWKDEAGASKEEVTFVDIDAFGRQAETIGQYLKKGRPILIEGRLRLDTWDDKQTNQKRSKLGIVLESFQFVDSGNKQADETGSTAAPTSRPPSHTTHAAPAPQAPPSSPSPSDLPQEEDDVPF